MPVEGAAFYEVQYLDSPSGEFKLLKKTKNPARVKFSKANCGQTYYFKVIAYQKSGKELIPCGFGEASKKTHLTGDLVLIETVHASQTTYPVTDLNPATPYKYIVAARAGNCERWSKAETKVTKAIQ